MIDPVKIEIEPPEFNKANVDSSIKKDMHAYQDYHHTMPLELIDPVKIEIEPPEFTGQNSSNGYNSLFEPAKMPVKHESIEPVELIEPIVIDTEPPVFGELAKFFKTDDDNNRSAKTEFTDLRKIFEQKPDQPKKTKKKKGLLGIISDILFYSAIITILFSILTSGPKDGAPKTIMGFSYFTVLTSSMQDEIPRGSFILVDHTDPRELKIGDDITYMRDAETSITHKIINIYENYDNSGERGFQTKGVNNADPDKDIVYEANVVGKVVFHVPAVGAIIESLKENIYIVFIIFGLFIGFSFLIRLLFVKPKEKINLTEKSKKLKIF